ncbi:MAG: transcriptional initiation protein Tat [Myxococcales bacterium]|nr:transcriptional initiation protein Tat [Myxococcales bacterium]
MIDRRSFLSRLGLAGSGLLVAPLIPFHRALAQGKDLPHRNFIFAYFDGGWDTLLSVDPRDPGRFDDSEEALGLYGIELGWQAIEAANPGVYTLDRLIRPEGSQIDFGPAMADFAPHFDVSCVVRGLSMDTVTHEVGRRYFLTGMMPVGTRAKGSSVSTQVAAQQGDRAPIPNLISRAEGYNEGDPAYASPMKIANVDDLVAVLNDGPFAPMNNVRRHLELYRSQRVRCDTDRLDRWGLMTLLEDSQKKARELVDGGLGDRFRLGNNRDPEMAQLRERYGYVPWDLTSGEAQAAMALQALKYNTSQCVTIQIARGLDSHADDWEDDHPERQADGWRALAQLVSDLKTEDDPVAPGKKLIDTTTVLVFSEFGRTSLINNRGGRDHSLTSACMLIGAGVPHNQVVGASKDTGMIPLPIDPLSGAVVEEGGVTLTPSTVVASLLQGAGLDTDHLRTNGLPCLMPDQ